MDGLKRWGRVAWVGRLALAAVCLPAGSWGSAVAQSLQVPNSYMHVMDTQTFDTVHGRMVAAKPGIMKRQMDLLAERYDLSDRPAQGVVMDRTKPVQEGVRVKPGRDVGATGGYDFR